MRRRRDLDVHGEGARRLSVGAVQGPRCQDRDRRPPRDRHAARGDAALRRGRRRRGRALLAPAHRRPRGRAAPADVRHTRAGGRPRRRADPTVRPDRSPLGAEPAHDPDPAGMPLAMRLLRQLDPPHPPVQGEAGRPRRGRDPSDQGALAGAVHRARRRQHVHRPAPRPGARRNPRGRRDPVVHRDGRRASSTTRSSSR